MLFIFESLFYVFILILYCILPLLELKDENDCWLPMFAVFITADRCGTGISFDTLNFWLTLGTENCLFAILLPFVSDAPGIVNSFI